MSLYQTPFESPTWAAEFALVKDELLLAFKRHVVVDALFVFALIILPMIAMIALLFLLGSTDPTTGMPGALDGTGLLIPPP